MLCTYMQDHLPKYFEDPGEFTLCFELRDNQHIFFIDSMDDVKERRESYALKKNVLISEWQIIWGDKYELHHDVLHWSSEKTGKQGVMVRVDLPGVFKGKPGKPKQLKKNVFEHQYEWKDPQSKNWCLRLQVNLARRGGAPTLVHVQVQRAESLAERNQYRTRSDKQGTASLVVDLEEVAAEYNRRKEKAQDMVFNAFEDAEVHMGDNGILTVNLTMVDPHPGIGSAQLELQGGCAAGCVVM